MTDTRTELKWLAHIDKMKQKAYIIWLSNQKDPQGYDRPFINQKYTR